MTHTFKLIKGAGILFIIGLITSALAYLIRLVLARKLSLEDFGLFFAVYSFILMVGWTKSFGLGSAIQKYLPEFRVKNQHDHIKSIITFSLIFITLTTFLVLLMTFLTPDKFINSFFKSTGSKSLILILLFFTLIDGFSQIISSYFLSMNFYFLHSLRDFIIKVIVMLILIFTLNPSVLQVGFFYLIGSVIGLIVHLIFFLKTFSYFQHKFTLKKSMMVTWFKFSLPMTIKELFDVFMSYSDNLILVFFRPLVEIGIYNVILPTADLLLIVGRPFGRIFFPLTSELNSLNKLSDLSFLIEKTHKYLLIILIPISCFLFVFAEKVLELLFGKEYAFGFHGLQIMVLGYLFPTLSLVSYNALLGLGKSKNVARTTIIANVLNLILNLILIPHFGKMEQGYIGAILGTVISSLFLFIALSFSLYNLVNYFPKVKLFLFLFLIEFIFIFIGYSIKNNLFPYYYSMLIFSSILMVIYPLILYLFNIISTKEIKGMFLLIKKGFNF